MGIFSRILDMIEGVDTTNHSKSSIKKMQKEIYEETLEEKRHIENQRIFAQHQKEEQQRLERERKEREERQRIYEQQKRQRESQELQERLQEKFLKEIAEEKIHVENQRIFAQYQKEQLERKRQEEEQRVKNQLEQDSEIYFDIYEISEFVKMVVTDMKECMPNPPYNWNCSVNRFRIVDSYTHKNYDFYEMGYENLSSDEKVYGLARAIAYNLGSGFEAYFKYDEIGHVHEFYVRYTIEKPLKKI